MTKVRAGEALTDEWSFLFKSSAKHEGVGLGKQKNPGGLKSSTQGKMGKG